MEYPEVANFGNFNKGLSCGLLFLTLRFLFMMKNVKKVDITVHHNYPYIISDGHGLYAVAIGNNDLVTKTVF